MTVYSIVARLGKTYTRQQKINKACSLNLPNPEWMDGHCTMILQTSMQPAKERDMLTLARAEAPNYHKEASKKKNTDFFFFFGDSHWTKAKTLRSFSSYNCTQHYSEAKKR